ncbi:MAG: lactonase family protein [Terracidiphilus sp.]|jgi:6-phosphogluconolactonase (cycloisomerase 2 family)
MTMYSRRDALKTAGAFALASGFGTQIAFAAGDLETTAYVGTYSTGSDGHGEGVYSFRVNLATGELTDRKLAAKTPNPTWIVIAPSKKFLYTINEVTDFAGGNGSVSAFAIEPGGALRLLNTVSSAGAGPAQMSLDASGKFAFVANYIGGSIAVLPVHADGSLGDAVDTHRDLNMVGPARPANAPPGSFAVSGHDAPHAHMVAADPANKFVLSTDLGQDRLYSYALDASTGKLASREVLTLLGGVGPRHFAFHPNGHWLYAITEESSQIVFMIYDEATGAPAIKQILSALPPGFEGTSFGSEIAVSPEGTFLYSANRLHDTISIFAIADDGNPTFIGEASTMGDYPRNFAIDPSGSLLFACNQHSDCITSFRIDRETGKLSFTGKYAGVGSPAMIALL